MDDKSTQQCWIFQRNPDRFDWLSRETISAAFADTKANFVDVSGHVEPWTVSRYFREMREGDIAFFWQSGARGGLEGWGKIIQAAHEPEPGNWRIRVDTRILLRAPIARNRVKNGSYMGRHSLFKRGGAVGANHRCGADQAVELKKLFEEDELPAPPLDFGDGLRTVFELVEELELPTPLSEDAERLLNVAAQVSKAKKTNEGDISVSSVFFAACEWGRMQGQEDLPRELLLFSKKVADLAAGDDAYDAALREYSIGVLDLDPDRPTYLPEKGNLSPSVKTVLRACAQTRSTQIRLLLLLQTVVRQILKHGGSGGYLWDRLPAVLEAGEQLLAAVISGTSPHVEQDCWTTKDQLGYFDYACAFENFLKDSRTKAPMTISIQAPWGGGKTSLMRMIQELIDPGAPDLIEKRASETSEEDTSSTGAHSADGAKLTFGEVEARLQAPIQAAPSGALTSTSSNDSPALRIEETDIPTIWFNAWTFQNHNQIWAGLGTAIIEGLSNRLPAAERESFRLSLNLQRIDRSAVRDAIHRYLISQLFSFVLKGGWLMLTLMLGGAGYVLANVGRVLVESPSPVGFLVPDGVSAIGVGVGGALGFGASLFLKWKDALSQPADVKLDKYFAVPDYKSERGFTYDVSEDLRKALKLVPLEEVGGTSHPKPIVIFIDDLDRCPPPKIAELFEAINLFLAGEFPNCIIILGMDSEIVAASLQKTHADIFKHLETDMGAATLGWRYMDKFVQLPFVVPSISPEQVERYLDWLVEAETNGNQALGEDPRPDPHPDDPPANNTATSIDTEERRRLIRARSDQQAREGDNVRLALEKAKIHFSNNPRALKRLANVFRFYMNLRAAREEFDQGAPTIAQLRNWVILMLRWPDFYRWLRAEAYQEQAVALSAVAGETTLAKVEALEANDKETWWEAFSESLGESLEKRTWFGDRALERFFDEIKADGDDASLAKGAGRGFW